MARSVIAAEDQAPDTAGADLMNVNGIAPCDPQCIEALGLAVHNFAWLEFNVVWIIEELEPNYWGDYVSKEKSAGAVANDLNRAIEGHAKGRATRHRLGCDLDLADHFARLIDDAHAGLFY
jgi:hypothetical protein